MISFDDAYDKVMEHSQFFGSEIVALESSMGCILAEDVFADRDFPPFNRATKDGIALNFSAIEKGYIAFKITGVIPAGNVPIELLNTTDCVEIMTGAVVPNSTDTVVMIEDVTIENGIATLSKTPIKGQNIHIKGSDENKGNIVLKKYTKISAAEIGVLAAIGKASVLVEKLPKITTISTGNELVEVSEKPLPHQIRKSNVHSLAAALFEEGIVPQKLHLLDDKEHIKSALESALTTNDVLLLSGGVSKGKFDYIPEILEELGVEKVFHRVAQRPGKPFWFGVHRPSKTVLFSFPGNPASTFANYHIYFKDWLYKSLNVPVTKFNVVLNESIEIQGSLTRFLRAKIELKSGKLTATIVHGNGSGDLTSLAQSDGFIRLKPKTEAYKMGDIVPFVPTRRIL